MDYQFNAADWKRLSSIERAHRCRLLAPEALTMAETRLPLSRSAILLSLTNYYASPWIWKRRAKSRTASFRALHSRAGGFFSGNSPCLVVIGTTGFEAVATFGCRLLPLACTKEISPTDGPALS